MGQLEQLRKTRVGTTSLAVHLIDQTGQLPGIHPAAPAEVDDASGRQRAQAARLVGTGFRLQQRHDLLPATQDFLVISGAQAACRARRLPRRRQTLTGLLPVVRDECRLFAFGFGAVHARFKHLRQPPMQCLPMRAQLHAVSHLLNQWVPKLQPYPILGIAGRAQQAGDLQSGQRGTKCPRTEGNQARQHPQFGLLTHDRAGLNKHLLPLGQAIDPRANQCVDAVGQTGDGSGACRSTQQVAREFLGEQRVALAAAGHLFDHLLRHAHQVRRRRLLGQAVFDQRPQRWRRQPVEGKLGGLRLTQPFLIRTGPVIEQQHGVAARNGRGHGGQQGPAGLIKPVQIVHDHQQPHLRPVNDQRLDQGQQTCLTQILSGLRLGVRSRFRHTHEIEHQRVIAVLPAPSLHQCLPDARARPGRSRARRQPQVHLAQDVTHHLQGHRIAQGMGTHPGDTHALGDGQLGQFGAQTAFAHAGFPLQAQHLPVALEGLLERLLEQLHLDLTPDEWAVGRGLRTQPDLRAQAVERHRLRDTFQVPGPFRPQGEMTMAQQATRRFGQQDLPRLRQGRHAAGQVDGDAVRTSATTVVDVGGIGRHLTRVQPHANRQRTRMPGEMHLQGQRRVTGRFGMMLQYHGQAKKRHDPVAQRAQHGPAVPLDQPDHVLNRRPQLVHGLFRAERRDLQGGVGYVREQNGHGLDFAPVGGRGRRLDDQCLQRMAAARAKAIRYGAACPALGTESSAHTQSVARTGERRARAAECWALAAHVSLCKPEPHH